MSVPISDQVDLLAETLKGKAVISVRDEAWLKGEKEMRKALVLKLSRAQAGRVVGLATVLKKAWALPSEVKFVEISNVLVIAKFDKKSQMTKVCEEGPWLFMRDLVKMQRWVVGCDPASLAFNKIQIWMQVHRLPVEITNVEVVRGVAEVAGKVCKCEPQNSEIIMLRFYRVKVEIYLNQPLVSGCFLNRNKRKPRWIAFKYERLPKFCYGCGRIGHEQGRCNDEGGEGKVGIDSLVILGPDGKCISDGDDGGDTADEGGGLEVAIQEVMKGRGDHSGTLPTNTTKDRTLRDGSVFYIGDGSNFTRRFF